MQNQGRKVRAVMPMTVTVRLRAAPVTVVHHQMIAVQQTVVVMGVIVVATVIQVMNQVAAVATQAAVAVLLNHRAHHRHQTHQKITLRNQNAENTEKSIKTSYNGGRCLLAFCITYNSGCSRENFLFLVF